MDTNPTSSRRDLICALSLVSLVFFGACNLHFDLDSVQYSAPIAPPDAATGPRDATTDADIHPRDAAPDTADATGDGADFPADTDAASCPQDGPNAQSDGGCAPQCQPTYGGEEICDGLDNNCDGQVDEGNPGGGEPCHTNASGICARGTTHCLDGKLKCVANQRAAPQEDCGPDGLGNGLDNDCNGLVDDGCDECIHGAQRPCYSGPDGTMDVGECAAGQQHCVDGFWGDCTDERTPSAETCNGKDDTCDGTIDQGDQLCPHADQICQNGACCNAASSAESERCNGVRCNHDSDCQSGHCDSRVLWTLRSVCLPAHCDDGVQNEDETGEDCGGSCLKCTGEYCADDMECASRFCNSSRDTCA